MGFLLGLITAKRGKHTHSQNRHMDSIDVLLFGFQNENRLFFFYIYIFCQKQTIKRRLRKLPFKKMGRIDIQFLSKQFKHIINDVDEHLVPNSKKANVYFIYHYLISLA